jgi:hypothetical protein
MPSQISVGGEQQRQDAPAKIIPNEPASSVSEALRNAGEQVKKAASK